MEGRGTTFVAVLLFGFMIGIPALIVGAFVWSLKAPIPNQEYVPLSLRVVALLLLLYFQQQFWRLVSRLILLTEACVQGLLHWPGPRVAADTGHQRLFRRFAFRTLVMLLPLYLLGALVLLWAVIVLLRMGLSFQSLLAPSAVG